MKTNPVKNLYCGIEFSNEEKKRANKLALTEFEKPVVERFWIEKLIEDIKRNYKCRNSAAIVKYVK